MQRAGDRPGSWSRTATSTRPARARPGLRVETGAILATSTGVYVAAVQRDRTVLERKTFLVE